METLGFKAEINGIEGIITNLKEYKAAMKAATDAQVSAGLKFGESSAQFKKAAGNVDALRSKMDSLNQTFKNTSSGSGIEKINSSLGTFKEGLANADFGKFKAGLQGIGAAMKAIPIFLIIDGIKYLIDNFNELKESGGLIGKVFSAIGDAIDWASDKIEIFTDWISDVDTASKKLAETQIETAAKTKADVGERYDFEIAKAGAAGKETIGLEQEKAAATLKSVDDQMQALIKLGNIKGELSTKEKEQLEELGRERVKALQAEELANIKFLKQIDDAITKQADKQKEDSKKAAEEYKARREKERADYLADLAYKQKAKEAEIAWELQAEKYLADQKNVVAKEEFDAKAALLSESAQRAEKQYADELKLHEQTEAAKKDITAAGINASASLAELVGQIALNRAKGNADKELQIRKTMFNVDKAFNVARAVQDGIRSVQAALTIPPPFGQILAGINAGAAAVNVGKIIATKFDGGSVGSINTGTSGGGNAPNIGGNINTNVPNVAPQPQQSTQFDENGKRITISAELVETQSRKVTDRIDKFNRQREY